MKTNNLWRLLAHKHWITLIVLNNEIRLCARCTGYIIGFSTLSALFTISSLDFLSSLDITLQLILCSIFSIPLALDWITQTWELRKSNNKLRFFTGFILSFGVSFLSLSNTSFQIKIILSISLSVGIIILGLIGKRLRNYNQLI